MTNKTPEFFRPLQEAMVALVTDLEGPYIPQAMTYALAIVKAAQQFPQETAYAVRTQLLYLVGNLEGTGTGTLTEFGTLAKEHGFDLDDVLADMLETEAESASLRDN